MMRLAEPILAIMKKHKMFRVPASYHEPLSMLRDAYGLRAFKKDFADATDAQLLGWRRGSNDKAGLQGERRVAGSNKESGCTEKQARSWERWQSRFVNQSGDIYKCAGHQCVQEYGSHHAKQMFTKCLKKIPAISRSNGLQNTRTFLAHRVLKSYHPCYR